MRAKIWNKNGWLKLNILKNNNDLISKLFNFILKASKFTIIDCLDYTFKPEGYTKIWLLAESHFAIHTFPEENKIYFELSSCNYELFNNFKINLKIILNDLRRQNAKGNN